MSSSKWWARACPHRSINETSTRWLMKPFTYRKGHGWVGGRVGGSCMHTPNPLPPSPPPPSPPPPPPPSPPYLEYPIAQVLPLGDDLLAQAVAGHCPEVIHCNVSVHLACGPGLPQDFFGFGPFFVRVVGTNVLDLEGGMGGLGRVGLGRVEWNGDCCFGLGEFSGWVGAVRSARTYLHHFGSWKEERSRKCACGRRWGKKGRAWVWCEWVVSGMHAAASS